MIRNNSHHTLICLAAFKGQAHIREQIDSLLQSTCVSIAVAVSVDELNLNAKSETCRIVEEYSLIDGRVSILPNIGRIGSAALNFFRLICEASIIDYDYVALSDQDDIWNNNKLISAIEKLKEMGVDAYSSNVTAFWSNGVIKVIHKAQPQVTYDYMFESAGPGCTFVLTRKLALDLQSFLRSNQTACQDVTLHDWFIYAFARSRGYTWHIDPEPHMLYRQHAANVLGANVGFKAAWVRWRKLRAGWLRQQAILIADILGYADQNPIIRIKQYRIVDRVALIFQIGELRRKWSDRLVLAASLLLPVKK